MGKKILVSCEAKLSSSCKHTYTIWEQDYRKNKIRNNGIFTCLRCAWHTRVQDNQTAHKFDKDINFFQNIDTEAKAYLLGIIAGDGALTKYVTRVVAHTEDIETLRLYKYYISPQSNIVKYKHQKCYYIDIYSTKVVTDICKHLKINYGKKSHKIQLPNLSEKLLWHFIRGLIDSDGSIRDIITAKQSFPSCTYASKSTLIKSQIKNLCDRYDISYTSDNLSIRWNGIHAIHFMNKIYENATIYLSRKHARYIVANTWIAQKGSPFRPRKIRKDKGISKGPTNLSEAGREKMREANRRRRKHRI